MSDESIRGGTRWNSEIAKILAETEFGILCMTNENLSSEWIHYEAGALSKDLEKSRVVPIRIGVKEADIKYPLAQFQSIGTDELAFHQLFVDINGQMGDNAIHREVLDDAFKRTWPDFEDKLNIALAQSLPTLRPTEPADPATTMEDLLNEMRQQSRMLDDLNMRMSIAMKQTPSITERIRRPSPVLSRRIAARAREAFGDRFVNLTVLPDDSSFLANLKGGPQPFDAEIQRLIGQENDLFSIGVRYMTDKEVEDEENLQKQYQRELTEQQRRRNVHDTMSNE